MVEVDESSIAFRTKDDPVAGGQGRSHDGKILIVGAVESIEGGKAGRIRLSLIGDYCGKTLKDFRDCQNFRVSPERLSMVRPLPL
jgi:hypothetical protein